MRLRLTTPQVAPNVTVGNDPRRPVVAHLGGLTLYMSRAQARALADQLHDTADQAAIGGTR